MPTKSCLVVFFLVFGFRSSALVYYVDTNGDDNNDGLSTKTSWKSIDRVNRSVFAAGDTIRFKRDQHFIGALVIKNSNLVVTSYGAGNDPVFTYPQSTLKNSSKYIISINSKSNIIIDGISLTDSTIDPLDHSRIANVGYGIVATKNCTNVTLRNITISRVGVGILLDGDKNTVENCEIQNLREVISDSEPNDDYGASGIIISGSDNMVTGNKITDCWAKSYEYGYDGSAIEIFNSSSSNNNIVRNNLIKNNNSFLEIGGKGGNVYDNMIVRNTIINSGNILFVHLTGTFGVNMRRLLISCNQITQMRNSFSNIQYLIDANSSSDTDDLIIFESNDINSDKDVVSPRLKRSTRYRENNFPVTDNLFFKEKIFDRIIQKKRPLSPSL